MAKKYRRIGVGVIWNSDRTKILIDRRLPEGNFADFWEFPGGKIELNESAIACIEREIKEELDIDVEVGSHLITLDYEYESVIVTLIVHHCQMRDFNQPIQAIACTEVAWVKLADLASYHFPAANYQIIKTILADIEGDRLVLEN
jgi:8-oxo-dGTP diphosphatase